MPFVTAVDIDRILNATDAVLNDYINRVRLTLELAEGDRTTLGTMYTQELFVAVVMTAIPNPVAFTIPPHARGAAI
jgi:hypothetical protein